MTTYSYTIQELKQAVAESFSYRQIHIKLGLRGYNYSALHKRITELNIDVSHIRGRDGVSVDEILVENSNFLKTGHLKNKLFKSGLKQPLCEACQITEWKGQSIQFHLHHVNGNYRDNRLENLKILCPNCHSQTENYGVKNYGKGRPRQCNK